jgi:hypothetical protein
MGATTKQQENGNAATKPNENGTRTERRETWGDNEEEARQTKKAQETSFDVSWAVGKFFSSHFIFCY